MSGSRLGVFSLSLAATLFLFAGNILAQDVPGCGNLHNAYGPFDYRSAVAKAQKLPIVETAHFTFDVESLRAGITGQVIDELDYTLRAFPNHHRALQSMLRYTLGGGKFPSTAIPSGECFFARAAAFAPDDEVVRILYGNLLFKMRNLEGARAQYEQAIALGNGNPEIAYNAGLFFLEIGEKQKASELADIAYGAGYPLPGLREKLKRLEKGSEPNSGRASSSGARQ